MRRAGAPVRAPPGAAAAPTPNGGAAAQVSPPAPEEDLALVDLAKRLAALARQCRELSPSAFACFCLEATQRLEAERRQADGARPRAAAQLRLLAD